MTVLKFEASVFELILDEFPNVYHDLKRMIDDKKDLEEKIKFQTNAMKDVNVRKVIIDHYYNIINQAKQEMKEQNQMQALRVNNIPQREFFKVRPKKNADGNHLQL